MRLVVTTWNVNSARLRAGLIARVAAEAAPDVLMLQEIKCADADFPLKAAREMGFPHVAVRGQRGYNGVAILSRHPLEDVAFEPFCRHGHARHLSARLGEGAGKAAGITLHDLYVPAGGDLPDETANEKFAHKMHFLGELERWGAAGRAARGPAVLVGDLNVAPLANDVWDTRKLRDVVSHTPAEREALGRVLAAGDWVDAVRHGRPDEEKVFTWWSYRSPDWMTRDLGRRLDHAWVTPDLAGALRGSSILREARGWERPSDHVPVTIALEL